MGAVAAAVAADREAGLTPFAVVANAGTTNTGAIDPLDELADLCAAEGLWFHVDGAYGASAALCPPGRSALAGMERADSLTIDPHKWLFQPYEAGAVLIREPGLLEQTYAMSGEYLRDTFGGEVNFRDRDIQLTRGVRALKLWLSVQVFGLDAFRSAVAHGIALAEHAEAVLRARDGWEIVTPGPARDRLLRPRGRRRVRDLRRHRPRRLRRTLDHRPPRPHRPPPLHHQPPHDLRGDRGDDRAHGAIEPLNPG